MIYKEPELVDEIFTYTKKRVQGLKARYIDCTLLIQIENIRPGTPIDEITIDYSTGKMELAETFNGHRALGEYQLCFVFEEELYEQIEKDIVEETPPNYVDASLALAMVQQQSEKFKLPDLSDKFVNEKGEKEPNVQRPK